MLNWEIQNNRISFSDEKQKPLFLNFNEIYNLVYPKITRKQSLILRTLKNLAKSLNLAVNLSR